MISRLRNLLDLFLRTDGNQERLQQTKFPDWRALLDPKAHRLVSSAASKGEFRVLLATSIGGDAPSSIIESLIGVALAFRGASSEALLCDTALPACIRGNINNYPDPKEFLENGPTTRYCPGCFEQSRRSFTSAGIQVHGYGQYVTPAQREEFFAISRDVPVEAIRYYTHDGIAVGEHAMAGALRYLAKGTLNDYAHDETVLRRYFEAALITASTLGALLEQRRFDVVLCSHGIYVPLGIVGEVARQRGIRVVNWVTAYRKKRFLFSHHDTYHHTMVSESVESWENISWSKELERRTMDYLESRRQGSRDWIWFHERPEEELTAILNQLGADREKPIIGLLTNVIWDAQLHFKTNAFENMLVWLEETIRYFQTRPDLQLVIRVHPAEIRGTVKSNQRVVDELGKRFEALPPNVFVVGPESPISTYTAMEACDSVIIYGTKTGTELIARGVPVIVAGEAWVRGKGLTLDVESPEDYFRILDRLPLKKRLDADTLARARKYAYHFFFRRMIPLPMTRPNEGGPPFIIHLRNGASDLKPGASVGLDAICQGILSGQEFIYPDETQAEPEDD